jgi:hypothetical protein
MNYYFQLIYKFKKTSLENLDCFIFVFSWADKQSFIHIFEEIKQIYSNNSMQTPKLIIGTKYYIKKIT